MEKYHTTIDTQSIHTTLNKYGVAIIPSLLSPLEIKHMNNGMWNYLEFITQDFEIPIDRNKKESWKSFYDLQPVYSMIIQHWNIGHAQHVWDIRQNPKVVDVYAKIWNCSHDELLTSFDASSFYFPQHSIDENKLWLHCDQSFSRNDFECVQSWITGYDVNNMDATLVILEGSHKYHKTIQQKFNITKKDNWYLLNEEECEAYYNMGCALTRISCPMGSMVLWDSRTIHCGTTPMINNMKPNFRNVSYICMLPRNMATEKDLIDKRKAFMNLRTTTHWANRAKLFTKFPKIHPYSVREIGYPVLTELGKKLAGF